METKKCSKCGEVKVLEGFAKNKRGKDGRRTVCKSCHNIYFRKYFADKDNMDKQVERVHKNKKEYRWKTDKYKIELGCSKCGYNKCAGALHFHHTNPEEKSFSIARAFCMSMSENNLKEEIDKCILLCANCHSEIEEEVRRKNY